MLTKSFAIEVKAGLEDGLSDGQFIGYASVFGNVDSYGDIVQPGAFTKTLSEWAESGSPIPVLWGHDMQDPFSNIGHVVKAEEDERGLKVHVQLDTDAAKAAQVYRLLKGRRVSQMSFAYEVTDGRETDKGYELHEMKLYEVSVVPVGANQETEILDVKSAIDALVGGVKAGRSISAKNESELRKAHSAIGAVLSTLGGPEEDDESKASGHIEVKVEEPCSRVNGVTCKRHDVDHGREVKAEEPRVNPSVEAKSAEIQIYGRAVAMEGLL